ncbi:hypothetical protein ACN9M1_13900 [Ralstonia sp. R-29]|uniref:hypothetical protein n=1 Tax=Ralstonia sp. R-29 TaxID=3404059 RepID=UPI003CECD33A
MDGLIELVFEGVPEHAVDKLVCDLRQGAAILEIFHSELGCLAPEQADQDLTQFLTKETTPVSLFVRTALVTVGGIPIRNPLVRVLRFAGVIEVTVVFESADIDAADRKDATTKLAAGTESLACSMGVSRYYCGFEPATDERTRLFSKGRLGPLIEI